MEFYFPEDVWGVIKTYIGFQKYYTIPAERKKRLIDRAFSEQMNKRCYDTLFEITHTEVHLCLCLWKSFTFLIEHNDWVQRARKEFKHWDTIMVGIATKCNEFLEIIHCGCNDCDACFTHSSLDRVSRVFYSVYMNSVEANRIY